MNKLDYQYMNKLFISLFHDERSNMIGVIIRKHGQEARLSTGKKVPKRFWKRNRAVGKYKQLNEVFSKIKQDIQQLDDSYYIKGKILTAKELKQFFCEKSTPQYNSFLAVQDLFLQDLHTKIGKRLAFRSWQQRERIAKHTAEFFKHIGKTDVNLSEVGSVLARQFENWLISKKYKNDYIARHTDQFIEVLDFAVVVEKIPYNPINEKVFDITRDKQGNPDSLTAEQVKLFIDCFYKQSLASNPLQKANDLFVFSCLTGLNYADLLTYDYNQHTETLDGRKVLIKPRKKSGEEAVVLLAPTAEKILEKYEYKLPLLGDNVQVYNRFLKQVFQIHGITRERVSSKLARSTFGNLVLNSDNAEFEDVARMLGHSNTNTTKTYYARINKKRVIRNAKEISYLNQ